MTPLFFAVIEHNHWLNLNVVVQEGEFIEVFLLPVRGLYNALLVRVCNSKLHYVIGGS